VLASAVKEMVREAPEGVLPMMKSGVYALHLGDVKVGDKPALGIGVSHKNHKDVSLFFDKETGLPAKSEVSDSILLHFNAH
jgi:hypothetical protein